MEITIEEMNKLPYQKALKIDKRTFCLYYLSLIKTKHIIVFSFFYSDDFNPKIIKIDLFFIYIVLFFTVNALFFTDNTIHKIYLDEGSYNFIYQFPRILLSSLIPPVIIFPLKLLALSERNILEFKNKTAIEKLDEEHNNLNKKLNIKFIIHFILGILLLICFWYYLAMFGVIFKNTKLHLIFNTLISFSFSLIYPFIFYLITSLLRTSALSNDKRGGLYKISLILQALLIS